MIQFYLLGFPVQIQPFFWLTCLLFGGGLSARNTDDFIDLLNWTLVVFISILIHELGHAFAGKRYGARPAIALHGLGGVTFLPGGHFTRPQNIFVSAAGPLASFLLGAVFYAVSFIPELQAVADIRRFIAFGIFINTFWIFINLLPILPLDGGQIFRDIIGPRHFNIACWVGAATGAGLMVWALMTGRIFLAVFAGFLAWSNYKGRVDLPGGVEK